MSRLDEILLEADAIIEKKAAKQTVDEFHTDDEEINKLASAILGEDEKEEKQEKVASEELQDTSFEKIARSVAILDTVLNIEAYNKLSELEKVAKDKGYSDEQIEEFIDQNSGKISPVFKAIFG